MLINFNHIKTLYSALVQKMKGFRGNWEQNDPTAEDYLKNRPFYSEKGIKILSEASEINVPSSEDDVCFEVLPVELWLEPGKKYTVIFNGTKYICTAWISTELDAVVLGNGSIYGGEGGNGEPFAIDNYSDGTTYLNVTAAGVYNVTIQVEEEIIHKLDKKFIDNNAIIDVIELPTENIDENRIYRALTGEIYGNGLPIEMTVVHVVKKLPTVGTPILRDDDFLVIYYETDTNSAMGYVDEARSEMLGLSLGWYSAELLMQTLECPWGGIILRKEDDPMDGSLRILLSYPLYQFKNEWISIKECDRVGWKSPIARGAEIFNDPHNIAAGLCSHAEGEATIAEGDVSHAEGVSTFAEGYASHAEGADSHAGGNHSHAEGDSTYSEGSASHAEGRGSHARGDISHSEGFYTFAAGRAQHVQGEYNAIDPKYNDRNPGKRAKYAHIVGNGASEDERSNAHTLDWDGNAWYAGTVYVGGTSQTNSNEVAIKADFETFEFITVDDIDAICNTTIQVATASEVTF